MCNINILLRKNINTDIKGFIQSVTAYSFINNHNGEGVYLDYKDTLIKNKNKIDYTKIKDIDKSKVIITHQRLSTSGHNLKYNHPFHNKSFVMVHNGVINQFKKNKGSDTYGFWIEFNKEFDKTMNKNPKSNRHDTIKAIIQKLFKDDKGFYSIFIYDKKSKLSYYFKDSTTNIHFYKSKNYWFITTSDYTHTFLNLLGEKFKEYKITHRQIYKIKDFVLYNCEKLPQSFYSYTDTTDNKQISDIGTLGPELKNTDNTTELSKDLDLIDYWVYSNSNIDDMLMCEDCDKLIIENVFELDGNILCCDCIRKRLKNEQIPTQQTTLKTYSGPDTSHQIYN